MAGSVEGKVAIVTGGGGGIGRATCQALAREGAKVVVADVDDALGQETAELIKKDGGTAEYRRCDVTKASEVAGLVGTVEMRFGGLSILVNNAGTEGVIAEVTEYEEDDFDRLVAINLKGVFLGIKYAVPAMRRGGQGGSIVNLASIAGLIGMPRVAPYVMSKHGVIGLTKAAALEYAPDRIRVNAVCPGAIKTRMIDSVAVGYGMNSAESGFEGTHPVGRLGQPTEIAELILWLSSDRASFCTGAHYAADGGYTAQ